MKNILTMMLSLTLIYSFSANAHGDHPKNLNLAKSPTILAGFEAAAVFAKSFKEANGKKITNELIGIHSQAANDEVLVGVYNVLSQSQAAKDLYGCHFHNDKNGKIESTHCHFEEKITFEYFASPKSYSIEEYAISANSAIELFESRGGNPATIDKAKIWKAGDDIQISFKWTGENNNAKVAYFMCHYHGNHIDCHRQSRPGPNEPQD
jgi:hypothetical protein